MLIILKQNLLCKMIKANLAEDAYGRSQSYRHGILGTYHEGEKWDLYNRYCEEMTLCFNIENIKE